MKDEDTDDINRLKKGKDKIMVEELQVMGESGIELLIKLLMIPIIMDICLLACQSKFFIALSKSEKVKIRR